MCVTVGTGIEGVVSIRRVALASLHLPMNGKLRGAASAPTPVLGTQNDAADIVPVHPGQKDIEYYLRTPPTPSPDRRLQTQSEQEHRCSNYQTSKSSRELCDHCPYREERHVIQT